ncbi:NAD-dependent epimerase/dehydratase family protein [Candidatus Sumerlaeota bacterium]|nr:NAD-dependent epimerase/dehydratase family protein [Candidatus Sumerlaeota bacterium]
MNIISQDSLSNKQQTTNDKQRKSRILITGATGFIGSHLAEYLSKRGDDVTCLVRKTSNLRWLEGLDVHFHTGEVTDKKSLQDIPGDMDYVYHLASLTKAIQPFDYYHVNAEGTRNILETCVKNNPKIKRFILMSSLAAAGPALKNVPLTENCERNPITDYGKSKLEAEKIAEEFRDKIPITIIRPPAVYGPRDQDILYQFKMIQKGWLMNVGKKDQMLSMVFAPDLVEATVRLAECEAADGETFFVCNPEDYSLSRLNNELIRILGMKHVKRLTLPRWIVCLFAWFAEMGASFTRKPALLNRQKILELCQPCWLCSPEKMRKITGYVCPTPIEKGFSDTAEWYKKHKWL